MQIKRIDCLRSFQELQEPIYWCRSSKLKQAKILVIKILYSSLLLKDEELQLELSPQMNMTNNIRRILGSITTFLNNAWRIYFDH